MNKLFKNLAELNQPSVSSTTPSVSNTKIKSLAKLNIQPTDIQPTDIQPITTILPYSTKLSNTFNPVYQTNPTRTISSQIKPSKKLLILFVGLPNCGKTSMAIEVINNINTNPPNSKILIDANTNTVAGLSDNSYIENIINQINVKKLIICTGLNHKKTIRNILYEKALSKGYKILLVDFLYQFTMVDLNTHQEYCDNLGENITNTLTPEFIEENKITDEEKTAIPYIQVNISDPNTHILSNIIRTINSIGI